MEDAPEEENLKTEREKIREKLTDKDNRPKAIIFLDRLLWVILVALVIWRLWAISDCNCNLMFETVKSEIRQCHEINGTLVEIMPIITNETSSVYSIDLTEIKERMEYAT